MQEHKGNKMENLEVVGLYKEYENEPLLTGVNFRVEPGETLCLLGRSGSGKSTILRIIAGIEKPDAGKVFWNGKDLVEVPTFKRNFGLMFQDYALFPHLTVAENVGFGLKMRGVSKSEMVKKVREALEQVNMSSFSERRVTDLSGGEQQRIALARALAPRPLLLMLDEPLAALDRALRVELQEELRDLLKKTGIPAIYVTHDQEEAIVVSDRLALLNDGRIVQCDQTEKVFQFPSTRWAASFLGMTNFIPGTVIETYPLRVRTDCGIFEAWNPAPGHPFSVDSPVTLLIKPKGVGFAADLSVPNHLSGLINRVQFRGDHYRLQVKLNSYVEMEFSSTVECIAGQKIFINLAPQDVIALKE